MSLLESIWRINYLKRWMKDLDFFSDLQICTVTPDTHYGLTLQRNFAERDFSVKVCACIDRKKKGEHFSRILFMWIHVDPWPIYLPIGTNIFAVIPGAPLGIFSRALFRTRRHYSLMRHYIGHGLLMAAVFLEALTKPFQLMRSNRAISRSSLIRYAPKRSLSPL